MLGLTWRIARRFANYKWDNYKQVDIQKNEYDATYVRSSGPGGQSVNTTNSKAELRLKLKECAAIDDNIMKNLRKQHSNQINKEDELIIRCQAFKSQSQNLKECLVRAQKMLYFCSKEKEEKREEPYEET
jgi:protein subunit release factor B